MEYCAAAFPLGWIFCCSSRTGLNTSNWENALIAAGLKPLAGVAVWPTQICGSSVVCAHTRLTQMHSVLSALGALGSASSAFLNPCIAKLEVALPSHQSHCDALSWHFVPAPQALCFPPLLPRIFLPGNYCYVWGKDSCIVGLEQLGCQGFFKEMKGNGWFSLLMVPDAHDWVRKPSAILAHPAFIRCKTSA